MADLHGTGAFGALMGQGQIVLARQRNAAPPTIGMPSSNAPLVDPATGVMTSLWLQYQTRLSADLAAIKKELGMT